MRVAGAALALGALTALPPRGSLAGWGVLGAGSGAEGSSTDTGAPAEGEGTTYDSAPFPTVEFGTYPQGSNGEVAPIEWYVLEERDGRRLLLSKYALDAQPYNEEYAGVTWETCTLRAWLNADFLEAAFSTDEQARIAEVELENTDNPDSGTRGGNKTLDRVFCLSVEEAFDYFGVERTWKQLDEVLGDERYDADGNFGYARIYAEEPGFESLVVHATDYAVSRGAHVWINDKYAEYDGGSEWWLRSPGAKRDYAAYVYSCGDVVSVGCRVDHAFVGVRPALWLNP